MSIRQHPLYVIWDGIKQRCYQKRHKSYPRYGGRGITMCDEWRSDFYKFAEDIGERPAGASLDRIDNDSGYQPGNVRWANRAQQSANSVNTIKPRLLTHNGETLCMGAWARDRGMSVAALHRRISLGWSVADALDTPILRRAAIAKFVRETMR